MTDVSENSEYQDNTNSVQEDDMQIDSSEYLNDSEQKEDQTETDEKKNNYVIMDPPKPNNGWRNDIIIKNDDLQEQNVSTLWQKLWSIMTRAIMYMTMAYIMYTTIFATLDWYRLYSVTDIEGSGAISLLNSHLNCTLNNFTVDVDQRFILFRFGSTVDRVCDLLNEYRIKYDVADRYPDLIRSIAPNNTDPGIVVANWVEPVLSLNTLVYYSTIYFGAYILFTFIARTLIEAAGEARKEVMNTSDFRINVVTNIETKFSDVAGLTEAKDEIMKIADMFKNRNVYRRIGAKIPKGILLLGPPGCGKTLLARAVAGEVGVPFISANAAEFDEKLVGVGAARVKKLFASAREMAEKSGATIIFIDEIDALGRSRLDMTRTNETLNMILTELDGFSNETNVMVIAASNIGKRLDPALVRSGRFDNKIYIDPPTKDDRIDLFKYYLSKVHLLPFARKNNNDTNNSESDNNSDENNEKNSQVDNSFNLMRLFNPDLYTEPQLTEEFIEKRDSLAMTLANCTPTMTGADIQNAVNQAAVQAVRNGHTYVELIDLMNAVDTIGIGLKKNTRKANKDDITTVAYHEAGHALVGLLIEQAESPAKMTIIPRGEGNLGYTMPNVSEAGIYDREQIIAKIMVALGGRAAECITSGKITTGASNDLERVRQLAQTYFMTGLSDNFRNNYISEDNLKLMSEKDRNEFENEIRSLIHRLSKLTDSILREHKEQLEILAKRALEIETIDFNTIKYNKDDEVIFELMNSFENSVKLENIPDGYDRYEYECLTE